MTVKALPQPSPRRERAERAAEDAREWNRDLRRSVETAKANARSLPGGRPARPPATAKQPGQWASPARPR